MNETNKESVTVQPTRDWNLVMQLIERFHERVLDDATESLPHPMLNELVRQLVTDPANAVLKVSVDSQPAGCFVFKRDKPDTYEIHTLLLPNCRGRLALAAGKKALQAVFGRPEIKWIVGFCPPTLPEVFWFGKRLGFRVAGMFAKPWVRDGQSHQMKLMQLNVKDFLCQ